jgi:insertion element IS1 protein InsB
MECKRCKEKAVKNGKSKTGIQRYRCCSCRSSFQSSYTHAAFSVSDEQIILLTKEGCGIRSTARILSISPNTVIRRIIKIGSSLKRSYMISKGGKYEVDELFTFIKRKTNKACIAYSLESKTGDVIDIMVGRRNKTNLKKVTDTLVLSEANEIKTDKLNLYSFIIPEQLHSTKYRGINKIERKNLNLRTHLKRLARRSICFSKSLYMLLCIVKIYFWG